MGQTYTYEQSANDEGLETLLSHHLRNPLSAIKWLTDMMLDGDTGTLTAEQRNYLEQIRTSHQQTTAVINELLGNIAAYTSKVGMDDAT